MCMQIRKQAMRWIIVFSLLLTGCSGEHDSEVYVGDADLAVLFVHGYTGKVNLSRFTQDMQPILSSYNKKYIVETYTWESGGISKNPLKNWKEANRQAADEAEELAERLQLFEDNDRPYYLIGYSLGAKVVVNALKEMEEDAEHLRGVYLLGAAISADEEIDSGIFSESFKIYNYYSPYYDKVLKRIYRVAEFLKKAGGKIGFRNSEEFNNYETAASHSPSDGKCNFLNMSKPLAHLIAYREGHMVSGEVSERNVIKTKNRDRWNDLITINGLTVRQLSCGSFGKEYYQAIDMDRNVVIEGYDLPSTIKMVHNR